MLIHCMDRPILRSVKGLACATMYVMYRTKCPDLKLQDKPYSHCEVKYSGLQTHTGATRLEIGGKPVIQRSACFMAHSST